jgi:hypothetical protein
MKVSKQKQAETKIEKSYRIPKACFFGFLGVTWGYLYFLCLDFN